jgi:hypothetical protein
VAKFFGISPHDIDYGWSMAYFMDALEYMQVCQHLENLAIDKKK